MKIPFNQLSIFGNELKFIRDAIHRHHLSGDGFYTSKVSVYLKNRLKAEDVLLTSSCTHALELATLTLDIRAGDEILLPSFTFPSTANAFVLRGAFPRFVDIRQDTLNMDEKLLNRSISKKTTAVSPVHYAGVPCQMDDIMAFAKRHNLWVIEDAAQALGAAFGGKPAGTFGHLNAISFHETKNVYCGEGGALIICHPRFTKRAEIIRQKGTNRAAFYRGEVDKYSWVDIGSSYVPSELQSAFLWGQLQSERKIHQRRKMLFNRYMESLTPLQKGALRLPIIPKDFESSYHLFYILLENEKERDRIKTLLNQKGINAVTHYFPLHLSKMGRKLGYRKGDFPVTESVSTRLLRLPFFNSLGAKDQNFVIQTLKKLL